MNHTHRGISGSHPIKQKHISSIAKREHAAALENAKAKGYKKPSITTYAIEEKNIVGAPIAKFNEDELHDIEQQLKELGTTSDIIDHRGLRVRINIKQLKNLMNALTQSEAQEIGVSLCIF